MWLYIVHKQPGPDLDSCGPWAIILGGPPPKNYLINVLQTLYTRVGNELVESHTIGSYIIYF